MQLDNRYTDAWGRVVFEPTALFELWYQGHADQTALTEAQDAVERHNGWCRTFDHPEYGMAIAAPLDEPPETTHRRRAQTWHMPPSYQTIDVRRDLLARCTTDLERQRVDAEMTLFIAHDLLPVLRFLLFMVDHLRAAGAWWGVGRGSSCASYCLYLMGVHKVDSIKYGLDIHEFLKEPR